jgi:hypothetical protein
VGMLLVCVLHIFHINPYYYTFHTRYEKWSDLMQLDFGPNYVRATRFL